VNDEANILSFIVRIWREDSTSEKQQASWRGHITSVPNGKRYYFSDIKDIPTFISGYLNSHME
jgi:hypothetical protein